jgi:ABC-2 type transport system permease protein
MNIFLRELKANLKSLVIWCVIMILFVIIGAAKFSAYADNPEMLSILNAFPQAVLDALSLQSFNLTTVSGFFGIMFVYFALMGSIAAAMWGSGIISKEERDKTVEFSLVLPVSRSRVITAKALAALVNCIAFALITWAASLMAAQSYTPDEAFYGFLRLEMEALFIIELIFLAIGLLLGCTMKQYKLSGSTAVGVILITYFLSIVVTLDSKLDFLKYFTPFQYYDASQFFRTGHFELLYLLLSAAIIVLCVGVAYFTYNHRDLYI